MAALLQLGPGCERAEPKRCVLTTDPPAVSFASLAFSADPVAQQRLLRCLPG